MRLTLKGAASQRVGRTRGFDSERVCAMASKAAPARYDTPEDAIDGEDEEVEIEIRGATHAGSSYKSGGADASGTMWLPQESNALEFSENGMMPETPITMRQRMRNFLRLPNSAIKQTWSKLDISEEGICEQEEYGEARDGAFWKVVHETLFGSSTMHGQLCGVILLIMIAASVILGAFLFGYC